MTKRAGANCPFCAASAPVEAKGCAQCGAERLRTLRERLLAWKLVGAGFAIWLSILFAVFFLRDLLWSGEEPSKLAEFVIGFGALGFVGWAILRLDARTRRRLERESDWRREEEIRPPAR